MTDPAKDPVTAWAEAVDAGKIVAGPHIRNTARRHLRDLDQGHHRGLVFDRDAARDMIEWFPRRLRLNGGQFEGVPFHLHESQAFRVGSLFGWKWKETGLRRFRRFYDEEGKGNGKSPMLAGIGIVGLVKDAEPRAEVYAAASKKDQAMVLFNDAVAMREQSPALAMRVKAHGVDPVWQLSYRGKSGDRRIFKPISSEKGKKTGGGKSGPRPHMALCDEVHEHPDRGVIDMLERGFKFRTQPLLVMATNSGTDRNSICFEEHTHAINVASGLREDDTSFSFVCSLDDTDDWENDESCWAKANPLLDVTVTTEYLRGVVKQARDIPGKRNGIARLHFCEWTDAETAAFSREAWMACVGDLDFEALISSGKPCYGGLDLSKVGDFTAFTLTWVLDDTKDAERFASITFFWTPAATLSQRAAEDGAPYDVWAREKFIEAVDGGTGRHLSYRWLAEAVARICSMANPVEIGCDQYGLERLREHLLDIGANDLPLTIHPQGFQKRVIEVDKSKPEGEQEIYLWMPHSINQLEAAIFEHRIRIARNPMMNSCSAAVVYHTNRIDQRMFAKDKAYGRIDGMVSLAMSIGVATCRERGPKASIYESRGVLVL